MDRDPCRSPTIGWTVSRKSSATPSPSESLRNRRHRLFRSFRRRSLSDFKRFSISGLAPNGESRGRTILPRTRLEDVSSIGAALGRCTEARTAKRFGTSAGIINNHMVNSASTITSMNDGDKVRAFVHPATSPFTDTVRETPGTTSRTRRRRMPRRTQAG